MVHVGTGGGGRDEVQGEGRAEAVVKEWGKGGGGGGGGATVCLSGLSALTSTLCWQLPGERFYSSGIPGPAEYLRDL